MFELLFSKLIDESEKDSIVVKDIGVYFYNQFIKLRDKIFLTVVLLEMCRFNFTMLLKSIQIEDLKIRELPF
jgi:hypothetical protein